MCLCSGFNNLFLHVLVSKSFLVQHRWTEVHREELQQNNSSLEFHLHRLKFVSLVSQARIKDALDYAKVLGRFAPRHTKGRGSYMYMYIVLYFVKLVIGEHSI